MQTNPYSQISFGNWGPSVVSELILKRGLVLPSVFLFRKEGISEIVASTRNVLSPEDLGESVEFGQMDSIIKNLLSNVFKEIADEYVKAIFGKGTFKVGGMGMKPGVGATYFFLLSYLSRKGYLGTRPQVESMLRDLRGDYPFDKHELMIEALFF